SNVNACSARSHDRVSAALAALVVMGSTAIMALMPISVRAASAPSAASQAGENGAAAPSAGAATATVLEINGAIGPATSRYVTKALDAARANGSRIIVLQIDTPGGLDTSMRDIIRAILASPIPVVSYVSPPGARAASAGTYILYASHIAAMAPATNLGAATPVPIGGGDSAPSPSPTGTSPRPAPDKHGDGDKGRDAAPANRPGEDQPAPADWPRETTPPSSAMERKVVNDAVAYIRGLAELRGRNADWAEQAVRGAASLSANAALKQNVIDVVARDVPDLLNQIDGREVHVGNNVVKLATRDLAVENVKPDWRVELLSVITNPTVAYGLLLIGIYGLLFEGYNPGAVFPGVVGAISLLVALFAFQILSVNYAGLALVAVGVGMIVAEFFFPTFGSLGLGGLVAFVVGSLILFDSDIPGMNIGLPVIAAIATVGGLVIVAMGWLASRSLHRPVVTGVQAMIGDRAEVLEAFSGKGRIRYGGEVWNARSASALQAGQAVRITQVDGLTLWVEPV
ncbi:MAG TPA: nodulation protein NfeD, partial [Steroidobacteraceae bacterium]|nr:nodulation protein NfeD [Steroidobacteraceae bacterium]